MVGVQSNTHGATRAVTVLMLTALAILHDPRAAAAIADIGVSLTSLPVVDPDGAGPLSPVALPSAPLPQSAVAAGGYVRFDAAFGNTGPGIASNTTLTLQLPEEASFVGALATGGVFVPAAQPPASPFTFTIMAGVSVTCTVSGRTLITCVPMGSDLPIGGAGTLTAFVRVNPSVEAGTVVAAGANITTAAAGAGATADDPNPGNNTTLPIGSPVFAASNLAITSTVQSATFGMPPNPGNSFVAGTAVTYRLVVTNNGPSDVANIRLVDTLPANLRLSAVTLLVPSATTFTCDKPSIDNDLFVVSLGGNLATAKPGGGQVVCTAPSMSASAPDNTATIDVTAIVDPMTAVSVDNQVDVDATKDLLHGPVAASTMNSNPVAPAP